MKVIRCILGVVAVAVIGLAAGTGCSDKPENVAARDLNKSTQQALDTARYGVPTADSDQPVDNLQQAKDDLSSAISKNRNAKTAVSSATMVQANLSFAQGQKLHAKLYSHLTPVTEAANKIATFNNRTVKLTAQQTSLENIIAVNDEKVDKLTELLKGGGDVAPLEPALQKASEQLTGYQTSLKDLDTKRQQANSQANDLQRQANLKLRQAEAALGQEKVNLSVEGLEFTKQSNEKQTQAQSYLNEMEMIDSNISVVKPLVEKLQKDIDAANKSIVDIKNSPDMAKLKSQLAEVTRQLQKSLSDITSAVKELVTAKAQYTQKAKDIIELFNSAIESYKKVNSSSLRNLASEKTAISNFWIASVSAENVGMLQHCQAMAESVKIAVEGPVASQLTKLVDTAKAEAAEYGKIAFEKYDAAAEKYESLAGGSDSCSIMKKHILTCYGKVMLAEKLEKYDISDKAAEMLNSLVEKVKECDPDFSKTRTAKLLEGKIDFIPMLAVDNTEYYEGIRQQYQSHGWPKLPIDQKEGAVTQLLENLAKLQTEETFDRQAYERILGPEKERLTKALESGFAEEETGDSYGSDPNDY